MYFPTNITGDSDKQSVWEITEVVVLGAMGGSMRALGLPDDTDIAAKILHQQADDFCLHLAANCVFLGENTHTIVLPLSGAMYGVLLLRMGLPFKMEA